MRILSRSMLVYNMILFTILVYFYLVLLSWPSLYSLNYVAIVHTIMNKVYGAFFLSLIAFNILLIFFQHKLSKYLLALYLILVNIFVNLLLINHFEKMVLMTNFVFLLVCYYLFEAWGMYLRFSSFNPKIKINNIVDNKTFKIKVDFYLKSNPEIIMSGFLVNYDSESCFILLEKELNSFKNKIVKIVFFIGGQEYCVKMKAVSKNKQGVGFLGNVNGENYLWYDVYTLLKKRGFLISVN